MRELVMATGGVEDQKLKILNRKGREGRQGIKAKERQGGRA